MAGIITDPAQFYKFSAPEIWADINPQLGEHVRLGEAVRNSIEVYNKAYPPPPPGWESALGTVILVAATAAVIGAAVLSYSAAVTPATTGPAVAANAAGGVNAAATTVAASAGTTSGATITASQAASVAGKMAAGAAPFAKKIAKATGNTTAEKISTAADIISGNSTFTDGMVDLYKQQLKAKNGKLTAQGEAELRALAQKQQEQYAAFLKGQSKKVKEVTGKEINLPTWVLPAAGILTAIIIGG